jgi:hypothetical protein
VRRKLGAAPGEPGRIRTFQGIGYLLDVEGSAPRPRGGSEADAGDLKADVEALDEDVTEDLEAAVEPTDEAVEVAG